MCYSKSNPRFLFFLPLVCQQHVLYTSLSHQEITAWPGPACRLTQRKHRKQAWEKTWKNMTSLCFWDVGLSLCNRKFCKWWICMRGWWGGGSVLYIVSNSTGSSRCSFNIIVSAHVKKQNTQDIFSVLSLTCGRMEWSGVRALLPSVSPTASSFYVPSQLSVISVRDTQDRAWL